MLTEEEEKLLLYYKKQLDTAKSKFIFNRGLLFGFLMIVFTMLIQYFFQKKSFQQQWEEGLLVRVIIYFLVGLAYAWYSRGVLKKQYNKLKDKESAS